MRFPDAGFVFSNKKMKSPVLPSGIVNSFPSNLALIFKPAAKCVKSHSQLRHITHQLNSMKNMWLKILAYYYGMTFASSRSALPSIEPPDRLRANSRSSSRAGSGTG
jgi:hypothetical protein